jgi:tRNA (guanine37-N1)-methyltransferase
MGPGSAPRRALRVTACPGRQWWYGRASRGRSIDPGLDLIARVPYQSIMTASSSPTAPWRATVLTLFPEMFPGPLGVSLAGRALASGIWSLEARDIRASATDKHRSVDDTPAGGGPGMVLRADVLAAAIGAAAVAPERPKLLMSPRGRPLTQAFVRELADGPGPLIVCGRFEGIDQRVIDARELIEVSIGDYVLSGGEIAALVLIDACVRLLPGVMGKLESGTDESFSDGLLEYPQYTRPQLFEGRTIPDVLTSGDHAKVAAWRRAQAEALTEARRPDLWADWQARRPREQTRTSQKAPKSTTDG